MAFRTLAAPLVLYACFFLPGCVSGGKDISPDQTNLSPWEKVTSHRWTLVSLGKKPTVDGTKVTLNIHSQEGIGGNAGVNQYGGSYQRDGDSITITNVISTQMHRDEPEGIWEQERGFLGALESVDRWALDDDRLTLTGDGPEIVLEPAAR